MILRDKLSDNELTEAGYVKVSPSAAKHKTHKSYRYKCMRCGKWLKQLASWETNCSHRY